LRAWKHQPGPSMSSGQARVRQWARPGSAHQSARSKSPKPFNAACLQLDSGLACALDTRRLATARAHFSLRQTSELTPKVQGLQELAGAQPHDRIAGSHRLTFRIQHQAHRNDMRDDMPNGNQRVAFGCGGNADRPPASHCFVAGWLHIAVRQVNQRCCSSCS